MGDALRVVPRQPARRRQQYRQRQNQRPADHLLAAQALRQPSAFRVAERREQHGAQQRGVGAVETAAAVVQSETGHQYSSQPGHDPEPGRRPFAAAQGGEDGRRQRQHADQYSAMGGRYAAHGDRRQPRKADDAAGRHHRQRRQRGARRQRRALPPQPAGGQQRRDQSAPERDERRIETADRHPREGQRQAEDGHADQAEQHAGRFVGQAGAGGDGVLQRYAG